MWVTDERSLAPGHAREDATGTLLDEVQTRRAQLQQYCEEADALRDEACALLTESETMLSRAQVRKRMEIERHAAALLERANLHESGVLQDQYEQTIVPFVQSQQHCEASVVAESLAGSPPTEEAMMAAAAPPKRRRMGGGATGIMSFCRSGERATTVDVGAARRQQLAQAQAGIVAEYRREVELCPKAHKTIGKDHCAACDAPFILSTAESVLICPECGVARPYMDATSASMAFGGEVEFTAFSYKRINHFNEWLNQFQAKETTEIPAEVATAVMEELYSERVTSPGEITHRRIRAVLKTLKLRKYYEHTCQIMCLVSGKAPPRMTPQQEEMCRLMFFAIQGPFEKHCPEDRKNFLSYSYCLYKFTELLGYTEFMPYFTLLKGRDKLARQDAIFSKICRDLDWEFISSV